MARRWQLAKSLGGRDVPVSVAITKSCSSTGATSRRPPTANQAAISSKLPAAAFSKPDEMLAVVFQLFDRLADIGQRGVIGAS
jgi:hypothetical protein